jgi:hypothetical protein
LKRVQDACGGEPEGQKKNPPGTHTTMLTSSALLRAKARRSNS